MEDLNQLRRHLLLGALASPMALCIAACARSAETSAHGRPAEVVIEKFSPAGASLGRQTLPRIVRSEEQWRALLSPGAFHITRQAGTERPYSGEYNDNHADGLYRCICCDTALFDSRTKFESGTGWPSFWKPISVANVVESTDHTFGMIRTAVECRLCDAHLGHVFDDGPRPTGLRYCMNSVALKFVPRS